MTDDGRARPGGPADGPPQWRTRELPLGLWGALVREARQTQGLSQRTLAQRIGVTQQTISKVEMGESCAHDTLKLGLAEALRVPVPALFPWPPGWGAEHRSGSGP